MTVERPLACANGRLFSKMRRKIENFHLKRLNCDANVNNFAIVHKNVDFWMDFSIFIVPVSVYTRGDFNREEHVK